MTIECNDYDSSDDSFSYLNWALETGIWNGREVSWTEASDFENEVQVRILELLFENPDNPIFEQLTAQLAWIGTPEDSRSLLAREIQVLDFSKGDLILQVGHKKSALSRFWKKHKKEILIGVALLAVATTVVVVATCSAAAAGTAAAGGAALNRRGKKSTGSKETSSKEKNEKRSEKQNPIKLNEPVAVSLDSQAPIVSLTYGENIASLPSLSSSFLQPQEMYFSEQFISQSLPLTQTSPNLNGKLLFGEKGLIIDNDYLTYRDALRQAEMLAILKNSSALLNSIEKHLRSLDPSQNVPMEEDWVMRFIRMHKSETKTPDLAAPEPLSADCNKTIRFSTLGQKLSHLRIGGTNGINTKFEDAVSHANYMTNFSSNQSIDWVYNHSNGPLIDVAEVFSMNYFGFSPNTSKLLQENWSEFHAQNADHPDAKYLQFCHSQGAIHVRNALMNAPKEIRDRVIVVAIAPAAIIPRELCFQSFNYASKKDVVPYGELAFAGILDSSEVGVSQRLGMVMEFREELIILDPHPEASGIDHDYQSPTFKGKIKDHLDDYIHKNGEYK